MKAIIKVNEKVEIREITNEEIFDILGDYYIENLNTEAYTILSDEEGTVEVLNKGHRYNEVKSPLVFVGYDNWGQETDLTEEAAEEILERMDFRNITEILERNF